PLGPFSVDNVEQTPSLFYRGTDSESVPHFSSAFHVANALIACGCDHLLTCGIEIRDFKLQGGLAVIDPFRSNLIEDDVFIIEDAVGDSVILLQKEVILVAELSFDLRWFPINFLLFRSDV